MDLTSLNPSKLPGFSVCHVSLMPSSLFFPERIIFAPVSSFVSMEVSFFFSSSNLKSILSSLILQATNSFSKSVFSIFFFSILSLAIAIFSPAVAVSPKFSPLFFTSTWLSKTKSSGALPFSFKTEKVVPKAFML